MNPHDPSDDDELPPHLRQLLDEGADGPALSAATQQRLLGRVLATVGVATVGIGGAASSSTGSVVGAGTATTGTVTGTVTGTAATTATTAGTATTGAAVAVSGVSLSLKAAVLAAGVGVAGLTGVGVVAVVERPPALPAREVAPRPLFTPPSSSLSSSSSSSSSSTLPSAPTSSTKASLPPEPSSSLDEPKTSPRAAPVPNTKAATLSSWELPQLESARAALSAGRAEEALDIVNDHARRAPTSPLREEGRALAVLALARLGRTEEAQVAAAAFVSLHPQSLFLPRVQRAVTSLSSSQMAPAPSAPEP